MTVPNVAFLAANAALVLTVAGCVVAALRLRSPTAYLLALYIVPYADIVLVLQVTGLFNAINRPVVAEIQLVFTVASVNFWL
jgi:hypothetical protein